MKGGMVLGELWGGVVRNEKRQSFYGLTVILVRLGTLLLPPPHFTPVRFHGPLMTFIIDPLIASIHHHSLRTHL